MSSILLCNKTPNLISQEIVCFDDLHEIQLVQHDSKVCKWLLNIYQEEFKDVGQRKIRQKGTLRLSGTFFS